MKRLLVTGASGFIGQRLMEVKTDRYDLVQVSLRTTEISAIDLRGIDSVIHLAGLAHQFDGVDPTEYYRINADLSEALAIRAKEQGVPHFLYVSSTKVYGDGNRDETYDETSVCRPTDDYGRSKLEAERRLLALNAPEFAVSILRPPLVYGPGVKGNLLRFMRLASTRMPLPFKGIRNNRAMVFVDNLLELMDLLIHQKQEGIFLLCESRQISTTLLFEEIRKYLDGGGVLFALPQFMWYPLLWLRPGLYHRLIGSFNLDDTKTRSITGYKDRYSFESGIRCMVDHFKDYE